MIPPEKPKRVAYFIRRENYTRDFMAMLKGRKEQFGDTFSPYGAGKTSALCDLYDDIKRGSGGNFIPIWLSLSEFSIRAETPDMRNNLDELVMMVYGLNSYYNLLVALAQEVMSYTDIERLKRNNNAALKALIRDECGVPLSLDEDEGFTPDVFMKVAKDLTERGSLEQCDKLKRGVEHAARRLSNNFLHIYNSRTFVADYIIFADDYCWIGDEAVGRWFVNELGKRLHQTKLVVSRTRTPEERVDMREWWTLSLTNFTPEEVATYLERRLGVAQLPAGIAENIYRFSAGHAQTVSLVADLLDYGREDENSPLPSLELSHTHSTASEQARELLATIFKNARAKRQELATALEVGAITRRFDRHLLAYVLGKRFGKPYEAWDGDDPDEKESKRTREKREAYLTERNASLDELLHLLEGYSFTEYYPQTNDSPYYTFHKFIRAQMRAILSKQYPQEVGELHEWIADYYTERLENYEEGMFSDQQYAKLYRYEDGGWQGILSEWAYHSVQMPDRQKAKLRFALEFFNAFSWWGWFLRFPFCDSLIREWVWKRDEEDLPFLQRILDFDEGYPRGYFTEKDGKGNWDNVRDSLLALFVELEIDPIAPQDMDDDKKELFIMMCEMLAGAYRHHSTPEYDKAEAIYMQTIPLCQALEMEDTFAYHNCFLGDLYLQMEHYENAIKHGEIAIEAMLKEPEKRSEANDYEVASLGFRIAGTGYLRLGALDKAERAYTLGSLCAYIFISHPKDVADPYTCQWYIDTVKDMAREMQRAWRAGNADVLMLAENIHAYWQPYWEREATPALTRASLQAAFEANDESALRGLIFPADPPTDDKGIEALDHPYNAMVLAIADEMHGMLAS